MKKATGLVIKAFRKHLNITQKEVATKLNITISTLANIENGRVSLDIEKISLLSKTFGINVGIFLSIITEVSENGNENGVLAALKHLRPLPTNNLEREEK